jgi:hypothetical protein
MLRALRRFAERRRGKVERDRELSPAEVAELKRLRDEQSPFRAKWGFFPK